MIGGLVVYEAVMMTGVGEGWSKKDCTAQTEACSRAAVGRGSSKKQQTAILAARSLCCSLNQPCHWTLIFLCLSWASGMNGACQCFIFCPFCYAADSQADVWSPGRPCFGAAKNSSQSSTLTCHSTLDWSALNQKRPAIFSQPFNMHTNLFNSFSIDLHDQNLNFYP